MRLEQEPGYSFPSSHIMMSTIFYGMIIYFIWNYIKNKRLKYILSIAISLLIICIGLSRIYLGIHYATDVFSGFIIGLVYTIMFIKFYILKKEKAKSK